MDLIHYMQDGADYQARAVLACLQGLIGDGLETQRYSVELLISRWDNGREHGYVCSLKSLEKQLNIAWFNHRSSEKINAIKWEQKTIINSPTFDTAIFDCSVIKSVNIFKIKQMAEWIYSSLIDYIKKHG